MKSLKNKILGLLCMLLYINSYGQQGTGYFYYYEGKKIFLELDTKTIALSTEGDGSQQAIQSSLSKDSGKKLTITEDRTRSTSKVIDAQARSKQTVKTYYMEIATEQALTKAAYSKQVEAYSKIPNVVMASPCFLTKENKKMGLSNNFYVKLKNKKDVDLLYEKAKKLNIEILGHNEFMPLWFTLSCNKNTKINAMEAANLFYETGLFESTEPAFMFKLETNSIPSPPNLVSDDLLFNNQWGLKNTGQYGGTIGIDIKAEQAWTVTTGSPNIKVAIYDDGYEMNHPDLQSNNFGNGYDTYGGSSSVVRGSHGTACAGIVGAVKDNIIGVSGVAPNTKLMSISIDFNYSTYNQLANGFNWAWQNGADIISNSWSVVAPSSILNNAITNALTNGRSGKGTIVVFASGNDNGNISYPANSNPLILAVGALSFCGERKNPSSCDLETNWGSNYGTQLDVMAPGVYIATTDRRGSHGYDITSDYTRLFNGTSAACPFVAGVAALVLSANPNLTVAQVNDIIERSAQKTRSNLYVYTTIPGRPNGTWNNQMGYGLVNAYNAVVMAKAATCPTNLTITSNVNAPNIDNKQASVSITATNIINSGAGAVYHAGELLLLSPGFDSVNGSSFDGYIQGCTGQSSSAAARSDETITYDVRDDTTITYDFRDDTTESAVEDNPNFQELVDDITIYPNPNKGIFSVSTTGILINKIEVSNLVGIHLQTIDSVKNTSCNLNLSGYPKGVYLIKISSKDTIIATKKVIIE